MARYRIDRDVAPASYVAAPIAVAHAVERRSVQRPWAAKVVVGTGPRKKAAPVAAEAAASSGWEEF
jgi:hypothetical protein